MARKRGNNDGSIRQRKDGRWECRVTAGYKADGKPDRLAEIIGHTNVAFTIQCYVHSDMDAKLAGMLAMEEIQKQA